MDSPLIRFRGLEHRALILDSTKSIVSWHNEIILYHNYRVKMLFRIICFSESSVLLCLYTGFMRLKCYKNKGKYSFNVHQNISVLDI